MAFGYHENEVAETGTNQVAVTLRAATAHGQVLDVYEERRESRMPFPCFRTNALFVGGMSGGPVFNSAGALCGLVCSGTEVPSGDEAISYAVSLWPAMAIPIDLNRLGHPPNVRYPAFDLVGDNILVAKNADRVLVGRLDGTGNDAPIGLRR